MGSHPLPLNFINQIKKSVDFFSYEKMDFVYSVYVSEQNKLTFFAFAYVVMWEGKFNLG